MENHSFKSPEATRKSSKLLSPEAKAKRRQFKTKFNIDKDLLSEKDIISIITSIESSKNGKLNVGELSKKLMNKLDKEKKGYVKTNDLIEEMVSRNEELIEDEFFDFFKKINEILQSKSEDIIIKLRKLQEKNWVIEKQTYVPLIEYIINVVAEQNFYDIENQQIDIVKNEGEKFLLKYSQMEDIKRKESDFISMRKTSSKYASKSPFSDVSLLTTILIYLK